MPIAGLRRPETDLLRSQQFACFCPKSRLSADVNLAGPRPCGSQKVRVEAFVEGESGMLEAVAPPLPFQLPFAFGRIRARPLPALVTRRALRKNRALVSCHCE